SQNLAVDVTVNSDRIKNISLNLLHDFDKNIENYLNGYDWTADSFQPQKKIDVQIRVFLMNVSDKHTFTANIVIQAIRPISNRNKHTTLFLYNDAKWIFQYIPNHALIHDELRYDS